MKRQWQPAIEPLLQLRTLNAAWYHDLLRLLPGDQLRINDWYERQRAILYRLGMDAGYQPADLDKLTIIQPGD